MTGENRQEEPPEPEPFPAMKMLLAVVAAIIAITAHKVFYKLGLVDSPADEHYQKLREGDVDE